MKKSIKRMIVFINIVLLSIIFSAGNMALAATKSVNQLQPLYEPAANSVSGNPKGSITVVEFFDYNCGYCRMIYPKLEQLIQSDNNVRVVYREYPVLSSRSILPAKAALAAAKQGKYHELRHAMMSAMMPLDQEEIVKLATPLGINTTQLVKDMQSQSIAQQIQENLQVGQALNIQDVPAFIVVRTTPPSQQKANVAIGPSIEELKKLILQAKNS